MIKDQVWIRRRLFQGQFAAILKFLQNPNFPLVVSQCIKMAVSRKGKPEMSQYLPENTKMGDFNRRRTLSGSFFVIPECLASICAVVLAFTANKHSQLYKSKQTRLPGAKVLYSLTDLSNCRWHPCTTCCTCHQLKIAFAVYDNRWACSRQWSLAWLNSVKGESFT